MHASPDSDSKVRCRWLVAVTIVAVVSLSHSAWAQSKTKDKDLKKEGEKLFAPGKSKPSTNQSDPAANSTWSIVIDAFRGDGKEEVARECLQKVRTQGGLTEAYMEDRGKSTVVAVGRFPTSDSKEAKAALANVRGTEVMIASIKTKPFANAFLAPPATIPGTLPEYDLRQAQKLNGNWAIYTLQIAMYSRLDKDATPEEMKEFRKAAEQAVTILRHEGEQAFYYHGPKGSMVTIGLFGTEDFDPQAPKNDSPALTALRQRFPYNYFNGQGLVDHVKVTTQTGKQVKAEKMQSSRLVEVPKSE